MNRSQTRSEPTNKKITKINDKNNQHHETNKLVAGRNYTYKHTKQVNKRTNEQTILTDSSQESSSLSEWTKVQPIQVKGNKRALKICNTKINNCDKNKYKN